MCEYYDSLLDSIVINNIVVPVNSHAHYDEYGRCKEAVYDRVFEMSLVILSYITVRSLLQKYANIDIHIRKVIIEHLSNKRYRIFKVTISNLFT